MTAAKYGTGNPLQSCQTAAAFGLMLTPPLTCHWYGLPEVFRQFRALTTRNMLTVITMEHGNRPMLPGCGEGLPKALLVPIHVCIIGCVFPCENGLCRALGAYAIKYFISTTLHNQARVHISQNVYGKLCKLDDDMEHEHGAVCTVCT